MKLERRFLTERVSLRTLGESNEKHIAGYAAKFAPARSEDLGGFVEEIHPNAFDNALKGNADVRGLFNHDPNFVLGRTKGNRESGTLSLSVDSTGLHYSTLMPKTQWANDLMVTMERGDVDQSSFGFICLEDDWRVEKDGTVVRTLLDVQLFDVSVVTYPAYTDASAQVRSLFPESEGKIPAEIETKLIETRAQQKSEKRYRKVLNAVATQKWAMHPTVLATMQQILNARAEGKEATQEELRTAFESQHGETPQASGVAVIPIYGPIAQRMGMFDDVCGGASCEYISKALKAALADDSIGTIVFDVDSPGGTVTGVPELAAEIYEAREKKPIIAVANGMAASAAYWIASAAGKFVVTPSGEVGSIGVYTTHQDVSAYMEKEGVKITFIQAGKYKTEGNPYAPLSDAAKADMQDGVDKFYEMFTRGVAGGRNVSQAKVISDFGQGRMLLAQDALAVGMVDEIASLDQVLAGLAAEADPISSLTAEIPVQTPDEKMATAQSAEEIRSASEKKTKRVDGEDLEKSAFAYQGSDELADWKLPIKFSTEEKTKTHIRNAISQWPKTDMPNADEKKRARSRIKKAAKEHGIELAPGDLAAVSKEDKRHLHADADGDDGYDTCQCDCNACLAGNCDTCEDKTCNDFNCMCCGFDTNASVISPTGVKADSSDYCMCKCDACMADNCSACSNDDCEDAFCPHDGEDEEDENDEDLDDDGLDASAAELETMRLRLKLHQLNPNF